MFRKLINNSGTAMVSLDKRVLQIDGVLDENNEIPEDQQMLIERVTEGAYLVRAVFDDGPAEVDAFE